MDATFQGAAVGIWLKNARAAARKAQEIERRRAEGLPVESSAGALSDTRREQLEEIDASWCPSWPVTWQRSFHLVRMHLDTGEALPTEAREVLRQGEDLGRWVTSVRYGWDQLTGVQRWMCEQVLGITPATEEERPKRRRSQSDKWAMNYEAAKQFYEREGHLQVPRKWVERIVGEDQEEREEREEREHKLGAWMGNQRSRAATLTPERMEQLSAIGIAVGVARKRDSGLGRTSAQPIAVDARGARPYSQPRLLGVLGDAVVRIAQPLTCHSGTLPGRWRE
ncbi:helicase associated domain-containing protein [Streptomyces sp. NBC_00887]|uniref:helicase associated domain-containing protein n=1 Tax=Streptomyces sp. NBC_00887 TaxID=2975859 RepID=UPI003863EEEC